MNPLQIYEAIKNGAKEEKGDPIYDMLNNNSDENLIHKQFISYMVEKDFEQYCHDMFIWEACKPVFYIHDDEHDLEVEDEDCFWEYFYLFIDYYKWVRTESRLEYMLKRLSEYKQQILKLEGDDDEQCYFIKTYKTYLSFVKLWIEKSKCGTKLLLINEFNLCEDVKNLLKNELK